LKVRLYSDWPGRQPTIGSNRHGQPGERRKSSTNGHHQRQSRHGPPILARHCRDHLIVHDAIKVGIDDALTKNIAPVMVGYEAMAQGLAILTGVGLDQSRDALLNVIKDLGAQLSAIQTVTPPRA
jgi:hypothetical protein